MCGRQRRSARYLWILLLLLTLLARGAESGRLHRLRRGQQTTTAEQKVLDLARHWRRSVQQPQSPASAQAVLIKPSPFDISSEAADVNEVETTSVPSLPPRSPDTSTASEATKPTKKANHGGAATRLHVRRPLVNMTKDSGDSVRLKCEVAGGRPGARVVFHWYKNDAPVEEERNRLEIRQYPVAPSSSAAGQAASSSGDVTSGGSGGSGTSAAGSGQQAYGSRLRIMSADVHDTGYYRCEARSGAEMVETTGILRVSAGPIHHAPAQIPQFPPVFPHFPGLGGRRLLKPTHRAIKRTTHSALLGGQRSITRANLGSPHIDSSRIGARPLQVTAATRRCIIAARAMEDEGSQKNCNPAGFPFPSRPFEAAAVAAAAAAAGGMPAV